MITIENWTYGHYKNGDLRAQITFGASPEAPDMLEYFVTVMDIDHREVFQVGPLSLEESVEKINAKYRPWTFVDQLKQDGDGCSSCSAH